MSNFPTEDLVPRKETNALQFVQDYPTFDGRGVVVGILDTGVDPGAIGLQTLPDGQPKLIDLVDCTGSGDVDVSTVVNATQDDKRGVWTVEGLSGKTLKLNPNWKLCKFPNTKEEESKEEAKEESKNEEPKKEDGGGDDKEETKDASKDQPPPPPPEFPVHIGIKRGYELFPAKLKNRVKQHRLKLQNQQVSKYIAKVQGELAEWKAQHANNNPTPQQAKVRDDLQARLDVLQDKEWQDDPGPLYDCVVFYDGENYRAAIDVKEDGDLTQAEAMTDYAKERQYGTFGVIDQFNYAVNIFDDGNVLSIVCDAGAHGSHVAGITAAYEEGRSGVAPGAQIISFKIGDTRLGSMETGTSLTRALIEAVKRGCDVINLSYGEGCVLPNHGRFVELAEDLVWKHGVLFVSLAGNNGPAISTVWAPGGTTSAILGVAAYVSPAMMKADYSMMTSSEAGADGEQHNGTTFTWSSVGPTADGDNGVNITAPGGAITCVPNWTMQKSQLMNGTSMSSPHATGCLALLLSACKAEGIPISPSRVYRAIEATAKRMEGLSTLQQGWGMVQVEKAWEYLVARKDCDAEEVHFDVSIENQSGSPRGVYLRQAEESSVRQTCAVRVDPCFRKDDVDLETQRRRIEFEMEFDLESTEPWVKVPKHFMLMHNGRTFKFEVDPTELPPGVHTAKVLASNEGAVMFSVPITVVRTLPKESLIDLGTLSFEPAEVKRFFLNVPAGAHWMDVKVKDCRDPAVDTDSSSRLVVLHALQLLPHAAYRDAEVRKYFNLLPSQTTVTSIRVHSGFTCEVDLARYWSAVGDTAVEVQIEFRGFRPVPDIVNLMAGVGGACVRVSSDLKDDSIAPSAKLTKWKTPLRPKSDGVVSPLGDRDVFPSTEKRIYQLVLTYEFSQEEAGSFVPRAPVLQGVLYESAYESQIMLIFDDNKKYLGVADAWPGEVKAPKGTVTIRLQVRHDDPDVLEKLKDMTIWIERKLEKDIALSIYGSRESMLLGKNPMKKRTLRKGTSASVFFAEPATSKIPSSCKPGDILFGTAHYGSGESTLPGDGKRPGGFKVFYTIGPKAATKKSEAETPEAPDERTVDEKVSEAVRDFRVEQLNKLAADEKKDGKFEELYKQFEEMYPDHLPLLLANLKFVDTEENRADVAPKVVEVADSVIGKIPEDELALHFGKNHDSDDPASVKAHKEMEKKKDILVEALARKARANGDVASSDDASDFESTLKELQKWIDIDSNKKYAVLVLERETRAKRFGSALKLLNTLIQNNGEDTKGGICAMSKTDLLARRAQILEDLGYAELVEHDKKWRVISAPKDYALF